MKQKIYSSFLILFLLFSVCKKVNGQAPAWLWAKSIGGIDYDYGQSIAVDAAGNIFTTGNFGGTVDFDPGPGIFNLTASSSQNIFILKLDASGNFLWAKQMANGGGGVAISIVLDPAGNIYTTGRFNGTADFDPSAATFNLISIGGADDIFISKLNNLGNFVWAKAISGSSNFDCGFSIAVDGSGNVFTTGHFNGTADFDPGAGIVNVTASGLYDNMYVSKLNNLGNFVWAKTIAGTNAIDCQSIKLDLSGNIYTTGYYAGTVDFDPGAGIFNLTSMASSDDIFISKLDPSGNFIWAKTIGETLTDHAYKITNDASGGIYITGYFSGIVDFDPNASISNLSSSGGLDIFVLKLDSFGNYLWAKAMGGSGSDNSRTIAIDISGNLYIAGSYSGTTDFDPSVGIFNLTYSGGPYDIFVSKLDNSGNFIWAKGVGGMDAETSYAIALNNTNDLLLTGFFKSLTVPFGSTTLTNADTSGFSYDIFISKLDHITGIAPLQNPNSISIYPNPTSNLLSISFEKNIQKINISLSDISGKIIYSTSESNTQQIELSTKDFAEGIYFVRVETDEFVEVRKAVVVR